MLRSIGCAIGAWLFATSASAGVIDFESGYAEGQDIGYVVSDGIGASFSCGLTRALSSSCVAAEAGPSTQAFANSIAGADTSFDGRTGRFTATDREGLRSSTNYYLEFDSVISSFAVDLVDFRTDGGGKVGDVVHLNAYNLADSLVSSIMLEIEAGWVDGIVKNLSISNSDGFSFVEIIHSGMDVGTAIDNITFSARNIISEVEEINEVPAPYGISLLFLGIFVIFLEYVKGHSSLRKLKK